MNNLAFLTTMPHFLELQRASFCWFLSTGLLDSLNVLQSTVLKSKFINLKCLSENFFFIHSKISSLAEASISTLTIKLFVPIVYFQQKKVDPLKPFRTPSLLFLGTIPLMTNRGTFILNGYEKICITQVIHSPGFYFLPPKIKAQSRVYRATLIPQFGSWITFELLENKSLMISLDKGEKIDFISFFACFGLSYADIISYFSTNFLWSYSELFVSKFNSIKDSLKFSKLFKIKVLNPQLYHLGIRGRLALNNFVKVSNYSLKQTNLMLSDLLTLIDYFLNLTQTKVLPIDMDHLNTKYLRSIGELLQSQVLVGIKRAQREFKTQLYLFSRGDQVFSLQSEALTFILQTFFSSSHLVQFLDQTNLVSELSHQRRLNHKILGVLTHSGALSRSVHPSYFGRICPIETTEGNRAGLTSSLTAYTRINEFGLLETPFFLVSNGIVLEDAPIIYLTSYEEQFFIIAPADTPLTKDKRIRLSHLYIFFQNRNLFLSVSLIQLIAVSSFQFFSLSVSLIPFIEHDDANRVLMGANMQRQAVPLLYAYKPIIGTGLESQVASTLALKSYVNGTIYAITTENIVIQSSSYRYIKYFFKKFQRSNQNTCINQHAIVWCGETITSGQILADSSATENGEISLGQNILLAYMIWNGFNFEDSILINERLVFSDLFTSITIFNIINNIMYTNRFPEYLWRFSVNTEIDRFQHLDVNGLIRKGTFVKPFDVLISKFTSAVSVSQSMFITLYRLKKNTHVIGYETSILATATCYGRILACIICSHENTFTLASNIRFKIIILVAQLRKLQVGDKLSGRHGNKGILAKILAQEDMPFLPNGQSIDIILNPLGVPSRMNVGQLFEGLLGFAGHFLKKRFKVRSFNDGLNEQASRILITNYLKKAKQVNKLFWVYNNSIPGKLFLRDGKTGNYFDNAILVCKSYILKLNHFVADKIQARSFGGYSFIFQQPVHGKILEGGQRFGEMEVWALEAFGAAYTLQELLTLKSDNIVGRNQGFAAILENTSFINLEVPASFNVLLFELKALGLNIDFYKICSLST